MQQIPVPAMADSIQSRGSVSDQRGLLVAEGLVIAAALILLAGFAAVDPGVRFPAPPDFGSMPVEQKKREFFAFLSPMIAEVNFGLAADRDRLHAIRAGYEQGENIGWFDRRWLARVAAKLEVPIEQMEIGEALAMLERRAGIVPESLVLAQAAIESGWGTSRFALEANNYFGQRCYRPGCGVSPEAVPDDANFGLSRFPTPVASVESYILNLNTHPGYREFRARRLALRAEGQPITGLALAADLGNYSERGEEYVADIAAIIRDNELE